jgi:ribose/xylose/arabinose/galactoside ABC-type transport system permease subunit
MTRIAPRLILPTLLLIEIVLLAPLSGVRWSHFLPTFAAYSNDLLIEAAPVLLLSLGMTVVLISGGIDLSVASMTALVACVLSTFEPGQKFWVTAVPVGLALGVGLGLANGLLIVACDVPPIIATLGTLFLYRGLCEAVLKGAKYNPFFDVPGYARLGELPGALALVGAVLILGGGWFRASRWRREILMIGGNRVAARYAAIPVGRRLIEVYTLSGILAALAAICFTAHDGSASQASYVGLELQVIVAVVLGGTAVTGGRGTLGGSILGVLLVSVLVEGLQAGGSDFWIKQHVPFRFGNLRFVLLGTLLVVGVWLNTRRPGERSARGG